MVISIHRFNFIVKQFRNELDINTYSLKRMIHKEQLNLKDSNFVQYLGYIPIKISTKSNLIPILIL